MGMDKAGLRLGGRSFVNKLAEVLLTVTDSIQLVGRAGAKPNELFPFVSDAYPDCGALGGIHAALHAAKRDWALIVACDLPLVTSELLTRLADMRSGFEAVAPIQKDAIPQPLCALYRVDASRDRANEMIKSGERRPLALLQSLRTRWVGFDELSDLDSAEHFLDNINTPDDYVQAVDRQSS